ncbi:MAG: MarR family transcriptional regulator [Labilithrix sp.]|nr:MarR family transcriptional regulator [Labilithrix sp.]
MADQDRFARALSAIARGLGRIARERARAGDVTPQQAETLQLIAESSTVSTSTLATMLGIDPSTASRNLSGLERSGLIARQKGSDDGRQTDVRLTPRGRRAAQSVGSGATQAFGSLLDKVPRGDRARLIDALEVVAKIVDPKAR